MLLEVLGRLRDGLGEVWLGGGTGTLSGADPLHVWVPPTWAGASSLLVDDGDVHRAPLGLWLARWVGGVVLGVLHGLLGLLLWRLLLWWLWLRVVCMLGVIGRLRGLVGDAVSAQVLDGDLPFVTLPSWYRSRLGLGGEGESSIHIFSI